MEVEESGEVAGDLVGMACADAGVLEARNLVQEVCGVACKSPQQVRADCRSGPSMCRCLLGTGPSPGLQMRQAHTVEVQDAVQGSRSHA